MTVKAGQKCTAIRRALVPGVDGRRGHRRRRGPALAEGGRRQPGRRRACAWARWPAATSGTRSARSLKALLAGGYGWSSAIPDRVEVVGADAERGAFMSPVLLRGDDASPGRAARGRGVRPGQHADRLPRRRATRSSSPRAAGAAWPGRSSPPTPASPATWCSAGARGTAGCSCSTATTRPSPPATARRCPCSCTAAPGRAGGGEEMGGIRGVLHHMQRTAVQASPRMLAAVTGRWVTGAPRHTGRGAPVPQVPGRAAGRGQRSLAGPRTVTLADIDALRRVHRRHLLRPHGRGSRRGRTRSSTASSRTATWSLSLGRRPVRRPRPRPGAGQLRPGEPALPHAGLPRRRAHRDADLQADHPPRGQPSYGEVRWDAVVTNQDGALGRHLRRPHPGRQGLAAAVTPGSGRAALVHPGPADAPADVLPRRHRQAAAPASLAGRARRVAAASSAGGAAPGWPGHAGREVVTARPSPPGQKCSRCASRTFSSIRMAPPIVSAREQGNNVPGRAGDRASRRTCR